MFTPDELARYSRHLLIPQIGSTGQLRLKNAHVLVIGAGGLGSPLLLYLAAAGVGHIGIVDFDTIDTSNLQRQVLFSHADIGKPKALVAKEKLQALNPFIHITTHTCRLDRNNALEVFEEYDIIADGTDNFATRYLVNDACVLSGKTNVYASVYRFEGQIAVFNMPLPDGSRGPNYRDLFPQPPPAGAVPNCAEAGVLGVLPGIIGAMQGNEVIKIITGAGECLSGKLFLFDALSMQSRVVTLNKNPNNPLTGNNPSQQTLVDYDLFCNGTPEPEMSIPEISVARLKQWLDSDGHIQVLDVREESERNICHIGGDFIPMRDIPNNLPRIRKDVPVIVYCRSGMRSAQIVSYLQTQHYTNVYNLKGGILAWAREIDSSIPTY